MAHREIIAICMTLFLCAIEAVAQTSPSFSKELAAKTYKAQVLLDQYQGNRTNLMQAQELIVDILKVEPRFVPAYIQAARITIMGGHIVSHKFVGGTLETAESILLEAKRLEPSNAEVYGLLGHVYARKGNMPAAVESLDKAKELKSPNPWLNNNYGDVYMELKKYELSDKHYQIVEKLGVGATPQQRRAYIYALQKRQWIAVLKDDNAEMLRLGKLATAAAPVDDAWTWGEVANNLFIQGYFDESIAHSRKALSIMNYGVGRNNLALGLYGKWASLASKGGAAEAEKYFQEAFSLKPDLADVVQRFRHSAKVVIDLVPIMQKRQNELRK
jgi:tetratricopeptide (TPR) repeat protein